MPDASKNTLSFKRFGSLTGSTATPPCQNIHSTSRVASDLVHAILNVEPAVVTDQSLLLHLDAAGFQLAPVGAPFDFQFLEPLDGQFDPRRFGGARRRRGGGRSRALGRGGIEHAREEQGGKTDTDAKHGNSLIDALD